MIADATAIFDTAWWYMVFPGVALLLTVLAFNLLGDGLQDALNPRAGNDDRAPDLSKRTATMNERTRMRTLGALTLLLDRAGRWPAAAAATTTAAAAAATPARGGSAARRAAR